jgi:hypothetical protein
MDAIYEAKEAARISLVSALEAYKSAAEDYGLDDSSMAEEIEIALSDAGLGALEVCA